MTVSLENILKHRRRDAYRVRDGLVNDADKQLMTKDAFLGESNIASATVFYIAADLSKDGVLDGFDYFDQDGIITGERPFDQTLTLYK